MSESENDHVVDLMEAERELLLYRVGQIDMELDLGEQLIEGAWTGSMGGHDPDFEKLKNGLPTWWRKKAASDPHPFAYCVEHLSKKFPKPQRICAWLKDQALGTTKWRNAQNNQGGLKEADMSGGTCKYCDKPATKVVMHAEGHGGVPVCADHVTMAKAKIKAGGGDPEGVRDLKESTITWEPSREDLIELAKMFAQDNPDDAEIAELATLASSLEEPAGDQEAPDPEAGAGDNVESDGEGSRADEATGSDSETGGEDEGDPAGAPAADAAGKSE